MKRKFTKLLAAFALLVFMMPSLVAWGQTRTETAVLTLDCATPAPTGTTSTALSSTSDVATFLNSAAGLSSAADKITCSAKSGDIYKGKGSGGGDIPQQCLKVGKASGGGSFTFTIPNTYDNIDVVELTCYGWKTTSSISINSGTPQTFTTAQVETTKTFNLNSSTRTITVAVTTSAVCITEIVLKKNNTGGSGETTTTTINALGITNTNKYVSDVAGSLSATVTYGNPATTVPSATVTWSGDNDAVATIHPTSGAVTLVSAGTVSFTAAFEGNTYYNPSSDTYVMTVTNENPNLAVIWSEDFSSYSASAVPSGGTYSYSCTNGDGDTKIYDATLAGGTAPELLVGKSGGTFSAIIPLLTPTTCVSGDLTLTYKTNANGLNVKTSTDGLTVDGEASAGAGITYTTSGTHTITFKGVTYSTENIAIVFTTTSSSNVRLDDIVLKGEQQTLTKVATPVFSPASGVVATGTEVTITCATAGATIKYSYDNTNWNNYESALTINEDKTIYAKAVKEGLTESDVATANYIIGEPCATPTFSVAAGQVAKGTPVELSTETTGATIYYTTDGSTPTTSSIAYASAITINVAMTIKAIAVKEGMVNSDVASASYTIIDYAELPFAFDGGKNDVETGLTAENLGTDYSSSPKLKFENKNDKISSLVLKLNQAPTSLSYTIKGNGSGTTPWSGTFKVQTSADGENYDDLAIYTSIDGTPTITHLDLPSETKYIKWIYTNKSNGNVALGNIHASANYDIYGDVTVANLTIPADKVCTIYSPATLNVTTTLTNSGNAANLIIEDGAQLKYSFDGNNNVYATVKKNINAYTEGQKDGWYTIASPVAAANIGIAATGTYDLYKYDEANVLWLNQELPANNDLFANFNQGVGYLYGNAAQTELQFAGEMVGTNTTINVPLSCSATNVNLQGFNLVGNPFTRNLVAGDVNILDAALTSYYYVAGGSELTPALISGRPIKPGEGFFVKTSTAGNLVINPSSKGGRGMDKPAYVRIEAGNESYMDQAYIQIGQGNTLNKMTINDNVAHVSVLNDHAEYAVATVEAAQGQMPVNFKAAADGTYTISVEAENLDVNYLHLIDNLTGMDVDLLATPSYTFEARKSDIASRFRLVFDANTGNDETNDNFAFINNGELIVNGNGTVQVIDILGRQMFSHEVNSAFRIQNSEFAPGVYVLRLVNGNDVKTQKIVIK